MRIAGRAEEALALLCLVAMLVCMALQVLGRYVLAYPLDWTEEASRYLFVWMVWLGAAAAIRERSHVGIGVITEALPPRPRHAVALAVNLGVLAFLYVCIRWGALAAWRSWDLDSTALPIGIGALLAAVPASACIMVLRTIVVMREDFAALREGRDTRHDARATL